MRRTTVAMTAAGILLVGSASAFAQSDDLIVMRRKIAPARDVQTPPPAPTNPGVTPTPSNPTPAPTPTPVAAEWISGPFGEWSSNCSDNATRVRTSLCMRRNDGGQMVQVPSTECVGNAPIDSETRPNYSSCSYDWMTTDTICVGPQTRSVQSDCRRSGGDTQPATVLDSFCAAQSHPDTTRQDPSCTSVATYSLRNSFDTGAPPFVFDSTAGLAGGRTDWYGDTKRGVAGYAYLGFYSAGTTQVSMHPGPNPGSRAILRFVAPAAGYYSFSGRMYDNESVDGVVVFIDGESSYVRNSSKSFSFVRSLRTGDSVNFEVDSYGNDYRDGTIIDLDVSRY